jgi:hypothetical protein
MDKDKMSWTDFCKEYAKKHGIKYGEALSKAGDDYKKYKGGCGSCSGAKKVATGGAKTISWSDFVKKYAEAKGLKYGAALKEAAPVYQEYKRKISK